MLDFNVNGCHFRLGSRIISLPWPFLFWRSLTFDLTLLSRGSGVGMVLALGCVGRLTSPLMDLRNHYGYFLHHVVYSSLALLAVLSILLLPESKRKPLPQTLADGEQYRRPPLGRRRRDNVPLLATPNPET